ncbi:MAG: hypothetical protein ABSG07_22900, partial [Terriglobales bacterium]
MDANESGSAMPYVVNSVITGGDCHAQSATPSAGVYVLGFLYDSTTSTGVKANVIVAPFIYGGGGGSCGTGTAGDLMEFTGSGATCGNAPIVDGGSAGLTVNVPSTGVFNANLGSGNAQLLLGPISDQSSYMGSFSYVDVSNTGNAFFLTNGPLAEIQGIGSADIGQLFIHGYNSLTAGTPTWYIKDTLGNLVEGVPSGSVGAPAGVIIGVPSGNQITFQINAANTAYINSAGKLFTQPSASAQAGLNISPGTAPTSPLNGDCWTTSLGLYCYINGATVGPYGGGTLTGVTAGTGLTGGGTSGNVTVNLSTPVSVANGGTGTGSPGLIAGTNISITGSWPNQTINSASASWPAMASGTNTNALLMGSGGSFGYTGTGTVNANYLLGS